MLQVAVTIVTSSGETYSAIGFAPTLDCPLAVTREIVRDDATGEWRPSDRWYVTHRRSGYSLGRRAFSTRKDAYAFLERCDPSFPAWTAAIGRISDAATVACHYKYRMALNGC